jgi:AcrR family transcriptional regulator
MPNQQPVRRQAQRVREVTRERLLATAEEVFLTRGYGATSVDAVAAAAGYTTGAVYSNFGGKADLFLAVIERVAEQDLAAMRAALDGAMSDEQVLAALTSSFSTDSERWRARVAATVEFVATARTRPELQRRIDDAQKRVDQALAEVLLAVSRSLGLPPPADLEGLTRAVNALMGGFAVRALFTDDVDLAAGISHGVTALLTGAASLAADGESPYAAH